MNVKEFPPIVGFLSFGVLIMTDILGERWATIIGLIGMALCLIWWRYERSRGKETTSPPVPKDAPQPPKPEPPEERVYTKHTPKELVSLISGKTEFDAEFATKQEVGKWIKLQARVADVKRPEQGILPVFMRDKENWYITLLLRFDAAHWQLHFQGIDIQAGESWKRKPICVEGKVVSIQNAHLDGEPHIILEHCEVVQTKE